MIFFFQGDIHGNIDEISWIKDEPADASLILLGDSGFNFFNFNVDTYIKRQAQNFNHYIYCVRGNHDTRPEDVLNIEIIYDNNVQGNVYFEKQYPYIRYFCDGNIYILDNMRTLVIGGAYSVDKFYRISRHKRWIENEQLTEEERDKIIEKVSGQTFDLVLTHTCPLSYRPNWLFLSAVDQSTVDSSTEEWMEYKLKPVIKYKYWLFGHFHGDEAIDKGVLLLYKHHISLSRLQHIDWDDERSIPMCFSLSPQYTFDKKY